MAEIHRLLKPDGIFVIAQLCYLPRRSPVVSAHSLSDCGLLLGRPL